MCFYEDVDAVILDGLTSSYPSRSAPVRLSSPASRRPLGRKKYCSPRRSRALQITTRCEARWKIATPPPTTKSSPENWAMTGGKEERGASAGRGMARVGGCWVLNGRCRHI